MRLAPRSKSVAGCAFLLATFPKSSASLGKPNTSAGFGFIVDFVVLSLLRLLAFVWSFSLVAKAETDILA